MIVNNFYLNTLLLLFISYLLGSFPPAFIAGKIRKIDIRYTGSKNVGVMNTFSSVGKWAGIMVIAADFGKGALSAFIAGKYSSHPFIPMLGVVAAMIGHNWMVFLGFHGGKGVSVFLGGLLYLAPLSFLFLCLLILPLSLIIFKDTYLAQAVSLILFSFFCWAWYRSYWLALFCILASIVYSIKSWYLLKTYFSQGRRDMHPALKKIFKPFFKEEIKK